MGEGEDRGIQRYGHTALLRVDIRLTRCVTQGDTEFGGGDVLDEGIRIIPYSGDVTIVFPVLQYTPGRLVVAVACHGFDGETGIGFQFVGQGSVAHVRHLVYLGPLPAHKHIIFVR